MTQNNSPRNSHVGKNRFDKDNYQKFLNSDYRLDQTEKDQSTLPSDTSTIDTEKEKSINKVKKRPKSNYKKVKSFFEQNIVGIVITVVIGLLGWLFINDYNFNANIKVAETNIINIEKQISEYKNNGVISNDDYINFEKEIENIKLSYAKLEDMNTLEKNYEILKTSIEKDIEYLKNRVDKLEK